MSTIEYAVRDAGGLAQRGSFSDGVSSTIYVESSKDISLNVRPDTVQAFHQIGNDLHVILVNGQVLILDGYFDESVTGEKNLFVSEGGQLHAVDLTSTGNETMLFDFNSVEVAGKWSAFDDMVFLDIELVEPVVAPLVAPLLGGLGGLGGVAAGGAALAGGAVLLGGGGGGDGGGGGPADPAVDDVDVARVVGGTGPDGATVTGTGEPGYSVEVTIGDQTQTGTIEPDGTWSVEFEPSELPDDGVYTAVVVVTAPDGTETTLTGPSIDIDTTPPEVAVLSGTQATGDMVNAEEHQSGAVIAGTGEAGANVSVEINGTTHSTTVLGDGSWSVTFASAELATGEYNELITITTTDVRGNSSVSTDNLVVDTVAPISEVGTVAGDDIINAAEAGGDITISGTGEAGATLVVEFQSEQKEVTVADDGSWSVVYAGSVVTAGTYDSTVTVTSTDAAGNSSTATHTVSVDTENSLVLDGPVAGDNIINAAEAGAGVTLTGKAEANAEVVIIMDGVRHTETANADGVWSTTYTTAEIKTGEYDATVTVETIDGAGNPESVTGTVRVDTETYASINAPITGDNIINATEHAAGVTISGTAQSGASVDVEFQGNTHTVTADGDGVWSTIFTAAEIRTGEYDDTVNVTATDGAGNSVSITQTVRVDTENSLSLDGPIAGDNIVNADEAKAGVTLTGSAEANSQVTIVLQGVRHTATANGDGVWSTTYTTAEIPTGEYDAAITVSTTDGAGNSETVDGTVRIDTENAVSIAAPVAGDNIINASEANAGVTLTGSAQPNASVEVTLQGVTHTVTAGGNGVWSRVFTTAEIPAGEYDATISVSTTDPAGNKATATGSVRVDTSTNVAIDGTQAGDNIINATESQAGVTLSGTGEPGSQVVVELQGAKHTETVGQNGTWSSLYTRSEIPTGEYDATILVTATDAAGNTATNDATIRIDTQTTVTIQDDITGDDIVNAAEQQAGISLNGTAEPGSKVNVTIVGVTREATMDTAGNWTVVFEGGSLPEGEFDATVTVNAEDRAGNTDTSSADLRIDTIAGEVALSQAPIEIDDVINFAERDDGVEISGIATPGLMVTVTLGDASAQVPALANGSWSYVFPKGEIPTGTMDLPITASIEDSAGNKRSVSDTVQLDTVVDNNAISTAPVEGDDVVNLAELSNGVTLTGTTEIGSTVEVTVGRKTIFATVEANGDWSVEFAASDIPEGEYETEITAKATDPAGNVSTVTDTVEIDTLIRNFATNPNQTADDIINAEELANGVTLGGTTEPDSKITVELEGVKRDATVDGNGNWTVEFPPNTLRAGTYEVTAIVTAEDTAGNVETLRETFNVDTVIETPDVDAVTFSGADVRRLSTTGTFDNFSVNTLEADGQVGTPPYKTDVDPDFGTEFTFNTPVSDGTHLVVNAVDDAGNRSSTLLVLQDNASNTGVIDNSGLAQFDIHALNLDYAVDTNLSLTETQVQSLSGSSDTLTIHGSADDTLTLAGATRTTETRVIDQSTYEVYTFGDGDTTLIIEQGINVII